VPNVVSDRPRAVVRFLLVALPVGAWFVVTYDVANDDFLSGLEALPVLVLRAHYTMDVPAGAVAACCAGGLAATICVGF
jgi:hypothetical protein